ncbi:aminoglycoside phosphotransferase family protein [Nonomuraea typhae]|uniref:Aminoglycoside phosphotransferase family protein n=1 Tax=Nonomuraea typhae TaxID=2603600 RepID=A0ABW7ZAM6_9ACTN
MTRVPWPELAAPVRARVEDYLGGRVVEAVTQTGGFSPAAAARLLLDTGDRAFVKAVAPGVNDRATELYRAEARVAAALPASVPAPRLLTSFEHDGWVVLLFENVDGRPPATPWRRDELDRVLTTVDRLAADLTPSPLAVPPIGKLFGEMFRGWRLLLDEDKQGLDPWIIRHLDGLAELESGWAAAAAGDTLLHADLRADNVLLTADRVHIVDWPYASLGASWFDRLNMLPSVALQGGPDPAELLPDPDPAVTRVLAALTGYYVRQSRQPPPPGIPTVRAFQAAQGEIALDWLRRRTGWA